MPHSTLQFFSPILFNYVPPIFFESDSICSVAPTSLSLTIIGDVKDVLGHNLNAIGDIRKKGRLWDLHIKFPFRCLKNLTSDTNDWILEHSSHRAVVVADDYIDDKETIIIALVYGVKFLRHRKGNLMCKSQSLPFLQISPIALRLWPSTSFTSSMIVRLRDVGAPEQMLSNPKKIGGT